jgi:hypothetical protein
MSLMELPAELLNKTIVFYINTESPEKVLAAQCTNGQSKRFAILRISS